MSFIEIKKSCVDSLTTINKFHTNPRVLRLDLVHPVISGNKWFKLKKYLEEAQLLNKRTILTFGGAFSNHILATAAAGFSAGLKTVGIIRGKNQVSLSPTLEDAKNYGMQLFFISREDYRNKMIPSHVFEYCDRHEIYLINEGGYGIKGAEGAKDILKEINVTEYTHIIAAVGTGTMLAGLTDASTQDQKIIGISVLKNNLSLQKAIENLVSKENQSRFSLVHDYHFGGYAKYSHSLIDFMNDWYYKTTIPSDFVYTGKLFYGINDLIQKEYFSPQSKLLIIHSGGIQGNRSLPNGTLIF